MNEQAFRLEGIGKKYSSGGNDTWALRNASLSVDAGSFIAIRGRSGAGKSTLLGLLGLMDTATTGTIKIFGENVYGYAQKRLDEVRRRNIGFLFQNDLLMPHLTIRENLSMPLYYSGTIGGIDDAAKSAADSVGLNGKLDRLPSQLSGGERTRAALARAIICKPRILLADEPTGALDSETAAQIMGLICKLNRQRITVVLVTHDKDVASLAERVVQISDGVMHAGE